MEIEERTLLTKKAKLLRNKAIMIKDVFRTEQNKLCIKKLVDSKPPLHAVDHAPMPIHS